jgi:hypothetical protein
VAEAVVDRGAEQAGGLSDLDVRRADRLAAAELQREVAPSSRPRPCRCTRPWVTGPEDGLAARCVACGRPVERRS